MFMSDKESHLASLRGYLSRNIFCQRTVDEYKVGYVLERIVFALEAGATSEEIKEAVHDYVPHWQPDRSHG